MSLIKYKDQKPTMQWRLNPSLAFSMRLWNNGNASQIIVTLYLCVELLCFYGHGAGKKAIITFANF